MGSFKKVTLTITFAFPLQMHCQDEKDYLKDWNIYALLMRLQNVTDNTKTCLENLQKVYNTVILFLGIHT